MRSIFQVCFNTYRDDKETCLNDMTAIKYLKFSPRLFEIKYSQRMEPVGFIQECNMFVVTEGEAARCLNFNSGERPCSSSKFARKYLSSRIEGQHPNITTTETHYKPLWERYQLADNMRHSFS